MSAFARAASPALASTFRRVEGPLSRGYLGTSFQRRHFQQVADLGEPCVAGLLRQTEGRRGDVFSRLGPAVGAGRIGGLDSAIAG